MLDSALDAKGVGHAAPILDGHFHVVVEGSDEAVKPWRTSNLQEDVEQAVSAKQVEGLGQVYEDYVEGIALLSAFLLTQGKYAQQVSEVTQA